MPWTVQYNCNSKLSKEDLYAYLFYFTHQSLSILLNLAFYATLSTDHLIVEGQYILELQ